MKIDQKAIAGVLAAIALLVGSASGYLYVSTPAAQQCEIDLREAQVRLELLMEAKDACKAALETCSAEE